MCSLSEVPFKRSSDYEFPFHTIGFGGLLGYSHNVCQRLQDRFSSANSTKRSRPDAEASARCKKFFKNWKKIFHFSHFAPTNDRPFIAQYKC
jgi:hypothetical protein